MQLKFAIVTVLAMAICMSMLVPASAQTSKISSTQTGGNMTSSTVKISASSNQGAFMILVIKHLSDARHAIQNGNSTGAISLLDLAENQLSLLKEKLFGGMRMATLPLTCDSLNPPASCTGTD
jgi:hypothetical protein